MLTGCSGIPISPAPAMCRHPSWSCALLTYLVLKGSGRWHSLPRFKCSAPKEISLWFHPNCPNAPTCFQGHWAPCTLAVSRSDQCSAASRGRPPPWERCWPGHGCLPPQSLIPVSLYKSLQILRGSSSSAHRGIPSQLETVRAWPRVHPWPQPFHRHLPLNGEWAQAGKPTLASGFSPDPSRLEPVGDAKLVSLEACFAMASRPQFPLL